MQNSAVQHSFSSGNSLILDNSQNVVSVNKTAVSSPFALRDGSFVFLRVLNENHKNLQTGNPGQNASVDKSYDVTFAGIRFTVRSNLPLKAGDAFLAKIRVNNGKIELVPQDKSEAASVSNKNVMDSLFNNSSQNAVMHMSTTEQIAAFLSRLGLAPDIISLSMVRFLEQSGFKLDNDLLEKARRIALSFPGREAEAAEVAVLLTEKGLEASVESVMDYLNLVLGMGLNQEKDAAKANNTPNKELNTKSFLDEIYGNSQVINSLDGGMLSLVNQIKNGSFHWIVLPFEQRKGDEWISTGSIRLLCDMENKKVKKIHISAETSIKKWFFVLYFGKEVNVRFCSTSQVSLHHRSKLEMLLKDSFASAVFLEKSPTFQNVFSNAIICISYDEALASCGFFTDDTPFSFVKVDV